MQNVKNQCGIFVSVILMLSACSEKPAEVITLSQEDIISQLKEAAWINESDTESIYVNFYGDFLTVVNTKGPAKKPVEGSGYTIGYTVDEENQMLTFNAVNKYNIINKDGMITELKSESKVLYRNDEQYAVYPLTKGVKSPEAYCDDAHLSEVKFTDGFYDYFYYFETKTPTEVKDEMINYYSNLENEGYMFTHDDDYNYIYDHNNSKFAYNKNVYVESLGKCYSYYWFFDNSESTVSNFSGSNESSDKELAKRVYIWCQDRFDYYDKKEGYYTGDKHDDDVFEDAARHFGRSKSEVRKLYDDGGVYIVRGE